MRAALVPLGRTPQGACGHPPLGEAGPDGGWRPEIVHARARTTLLASACLRGQGADSLTAKFQHAVSELRAALRDGLQRHADAPRAAAEALRTQLGLDQEEDEEPGAQAGQASARRKRHRTAEEEVPVLLGGTSVIVRTETHPYEIEATSAAVMAVVNFCVERLKDDPIVLKRDARRAGEQQAAASAEVASASAAAPAPCSSAKGGFSFGQADCPSILGKITWHPSRKAWAVHYKNSAKQPVTKRIQVGKTTSAAGVLGASASDAPQRWATARRAAYEEAIRLWNELDCTKRDRIELMEGSGSAAPALGAAASASASAASAEGGTP